MTKLESLLVKATKDLPRPFGVFLSGGLDSGVLAALTKPDYAITCTFRDNGEYYDEFEYAKAICDHLGIEQVVEEPSGDDFQEVMKKALEIIGYPVNSVSIYPWYKVMERAKNLGLKHMVGGEGSDETFGGYSRYLILKQIYELYQLDSLKGYKPMLNSIFGSFAQTHSKLCGVAPNTLLMRYKEKEGIINKIGWAEFTESLEPIKRMELALAEHFGITLHLPYYDKDVQDYGWSLSDEEKIEGEIRKLQVYKVAKKYLPDKVWQRKDKKGFVSPCNKWCGSSDYDKKNYLMFQQQIFHV